MEFEIIGSFNGYSVSWSNSEMRLLSISRMTEWVRRAVRGLWSKLDLRSSGSELAGLAADACRPRHELVVENAVLRHQLNVLRRHVKRPALGPIDRLKLVIGATLLPCWRGAIAIVQPDTILRWHRAGFRLFWRSRCRPRRGSPLPAETVELIRDMARRGRLWGAERIRGELLKLGKAGISPEFGAVRIRWIARRKNQGAQRRAHARLRQLVPLAPRATKSYSLADLGVDLEIAAYEND